jgi:prevent-host-death family protein
MKRVKIADLKAHLSEHLRAVRRGETVTVLDRDRPVARIVPYDSAGPARIRKPVPGAGRLGEIPLPPPLRGRGDIVQLLLEDRARGR